jgi:hypothetical protein
MPRRASARLGAPRGPRGRVRPCRHAARRLAPRAVSRELHQQNAPPHRRRRGRRRGRDDDDDDRALAPSRTRIASESAPRSPHPAQNALARGLARARPRTTACIELAGTAERPQRVLRAMSDAAHTKELAERAATRAHALRARRHARSACALGAPSNALLADAVLGACASRISPRTSMQRRSGGRSSARRTRTVSPRSSTSPRPRAAVAARIPRRCPRAARPRPALTPSPRTRRRTPSGAHGPRPPLVVRPTEPAAARVPAHVRAGGARAQGPRARGGGRAALSFDA